MLFRAFRVVMAGSAAKGMFGLKDRVGDELTCVLVLQPVEHPGAFLACGHQPAQAHFGQMLGDGGGRLMHEFSEPIDRQLTLTEGKNDANPCRVGKHREDLHREFHELAVRLAPANLIICIHT